MTTSSGRAPGEGGDNDDDNQAGRDPGVPRPPSREDLDRISADQALITDEWADEGPQAEGGGAGREPGGDPAEGGVKP